MSSPSIVSSLHAPRAVAPLRPVRGVAVGLAMIVVWAVWAAVFNTGQFGDNIEQFNWAQSLELGYHKHPPLPSWALAGLIELFGPSIYWAYALATACLLGTAAFTWSIGRRLLGDRVAAAAIILWGLSLSFSQRAQLYNHNTVLVLCFAAAVWFTLRASESTVPARAALWWTGAGVAAAAAILSKYQALVPLGGLIWALAGSGRLGTRAARQGLAGAIGLAVLLCTPHAIWVARHGFSTLRYASEAVETSTLPQRFGFIVSFIANQVRIESPALLAIGLCWAAARWWQAPVAAHADPGTPEAPTTTRLGPWFFGLLGSGLIVLAVMALGAGVSLRNHWGVQALQFLPLWLACRWDRRRPIDLRMLVCIAMTIHAVSLGIYAAEHSDPTTVLSSRRIDTAYPARRLAEKAVAHWTETTACPLRYVAGTVFDSGLVALYSGGHLQVFDNAPATPWVRPDDLQRDGALYVLDGDDVAPPGVTNIVPFDLLPVDVHGRSKKTLRIGVLLPRLPCGDD